MLQQMTLFEAGASPTVSAPVVQDKVPLQAPKAAASADIPLPPSVARSTAVLPQDYPICVQAYWAHHGCGQRYFVEHRTDGLFFMSTRRDADTHCADCGEPLRVQDMIADVPYSEKLLRPSPQRVLTRCDPRKKAQRLIHGLLVENEEWRDEERDGVVVAYYMERWRNRLSGDEEPLRVALRIDGQKVILLGAATAPDYDRNVLHVRQRYAHYRDALPAMLSWALETARQHMADASLRGINQAQAGEVVAWIN
jgi:hypothetical protein